MREFRTKKNPHNPNNGLQWSDFKGTVPSLDDGYFFSNILDIKSSIFSLDFINPSNQKRLDLIFKLHKKG